MEKGKRLLTSKVNQIKKAIIQQMKINQWLLTKIKLISILKK